MEKKTISIIIIISLLISNIFFALVAFLPNKRIQYFRTNLTPNGYIEESFQVKELKNIISIDIYGHGLNVSSAIYACITNTSGEDYLNFYTRGSTHVIEEYGMDEDSGKDISVHITEISYYGLDPHSWVYLVIIGFNYDTYKFNSENLNVSVFITYNDYIYE